MTKPEETPVKQSGKTCREYHKEFDKIYDAQTIEDELSWLSMYPGKRKTIISCPDWLCRMIEEEPNGKNNNSSK